MSIGNLKITIAQLNPVAGDVVGNMEKIREIYFEAEERGRNLVVTPELSVTGCPLEDLVGHPDLLAAADAALAVLRNATRGGKAVLAVGAPRRDAAGVHNATAVFRDGEVVRAIRENNRAGCGAFERARNSASGSGASLPFDLDGIKVGIFSCGDGCLSDASRELRDNGAEVLVCVAASPFRPEALGTRVTDAAVQKEDGAGLPFFYVNMVGGQDETVFDGGSFFLDREGRRLLQLPQFEECVQDYDCDSDGDDLGDEFPDPLECVWRAMMLGLGDYVRKSGFTDVMLGLSGGMDSALAAAVAGDCLGAEHVHCVRLPSKYTAGISNSAAEEMCRTWGFSMDTLPIGEVVAAADSTLAPMFPGGVKKLTAENMQARARGYLLMTISNDRDWLLLSTGNKSEIAVGYSTLYGDMCGAFNPLKDVFKTEVYALAKWRNRHRPSGLLGPSGVAVPVEIIERPPSAELSPEQKDTDSLPPYPVLDAILAAMLEEKLPVSDIVARGFESGVVKRVHGMLKRAEYKRRQGAPGPGISHRAFPYVLRMPIVNGFNASMIDVLKDV